MLYARGLHVAEVSSMSREEQLVGCHRKQSGSLDAVGPKVGVRR